MNIIRLCVLYVYNVTMQARPDYLVLGHVSKDLLPGGGGARAGGTVTYSSIAAQKLGLQAAIVTALSPEDEGLLDEMKDEGVWVCAVASDGTTTFENVYDDQGRRTQRIGTPASLIEWSDVPPEWRGAGIAHLGPVAQEIPAGMSALFRYSLLGITPQGWMRSWDAEGRVTQAAWPVPGALAGLPDNACLVLSMEDMGWDDALLREYTGLARMVVVTQSAEDALIYVPRSETGRAEGQTALEKVEIKVPALAARPVDPTGAGDVFATAFLVRYYETRNPLAAAVFAHAAAACAIEAVGPTGVASRETVLSRLKGS
jgi:sugar/nucleoside kinase (ribokinase family)